MHPRLQRPIIELAPHQIELNRLVEENSPALLLVNKSKKIGVTDIFLRIIAHKAFSKYLGPIDNPGEVMIVAGNRWEHVVGTEADKTRVMPRFQALFRNLGGYIAKVDSKSMLIEYQDQYCVINAYPSNHTALIGKPNVRAIYLDEAGFTGQTDDQPIFSNLEANLANTRGDCFIVSTPNGLRGTFSAMCKQRPQGWIYKEYDYTVGLSSGILDPEFIENAQKNPSINFSQDYCCEFSTSSNAILNESDLNGVII